MTSAYPLVIHDVDQLDDLLSQPTEGLVASLSRVKGDILILGVAGKMGPTLARMARRALDQAGLKDRVIGVSRFSNPEERSRLESWGIETQQCDLLDEDAISKIPSATNVVYMAGMKFGSTGNESMTWAMNTYLPALVCRRFPTSRIVAFSTGNVYGLVPVKAGGSREQDAPNPEGEYAMSCLGRERMFQYFSSARKSPIALIRLNYACELRYGVLVDLARKVWSGEKIPLAMGYMNVIWQADANRMTLQALEHVNSPARLLNVAGPEILSVRQVCEEFAAKMGRAVDFSGTESPDALLNNGELGFRLFGPAEVKASQLIDWIAEWVIRGGESLGKPTHFEVRDGKF